MSLEVEVLNVMADILDVEVKELDKNKKLCDSIGVDSTEVVELIISLSKHFGIKIANNEITKFSTPLEIVNLIERKKQTTAQ